MTTLHTLASGSSGNALLLSCGDTRLLVDAGISCRRIAAGLRALGLSPDDLTAVLITHTHTDHIAGLQTLLKHTEIPIAATAQTGRGLAYRLAGVEDRLLDVPLCSPFSLGCCTVTAFPTSHDAPGSCGFRFDTEDGSVGVLTDTGYVTDEAAGILPGVNLAVLEANHDIETLRSGPYPCYLKQRILGSQGHLSNEDAARFAVTLAEAGASELILAHLSRENNTPAMARNAVETALSAAGLAPALCVAPRDCMGEAHLVTRRSVCRK
ncbi:MAG: MBL fold metallo-hydrolase [Oscillospiraceae bacterium]|nr:MBL fold metallo-hydrolase [Oscillospiraceae bacterium]